MFLVVHHELDDYQITLSYLIVHAKNRNVVSEHSFNNCYMWNHVLMHDDTCIMYAWVWLIMSCVKSLTWYCHCRYQLWKEISEESISIVFEHVLCVDLDSLSLNI